MGSSRLPGKSLMTLGNTTVIGFLLNSLVEYGFNMDQIYIATSVDKKDRVLMEYVQNLGYVCFTGPELNVLSRYQLAARYVNEDVIVRLTGDNPFICPSLVRCCANFHLKSGVMVTSTRIITPNGGIVRNAPKGSSVDIFQKKSLLEVDTNECNDFDREHVIPALFRDNKVNLITKDILVRCGIDFNKIIGVSIDNESDYKKACEIAKIIKPTTC
jgi:spore coat polysaccharide biosynthesis protein SpsF (cytidylyltransferase family)